MSRVADFLSGALFALAISSMAADAQRVEIRCQPVELRPLAPCGLQAYFRNHHTPLRCRQS